MKINKKVLGNILLILTAFIWGTAFVGQRQGMEHMGPITFNACRMALAALTIGTTASATCCQLGFSNIKARTVDRTVTVKNCMADNSTGLARCTK